MTTTGPQMPTPTPTTPLTAPIPSKLSSWPMVIGIIATILGSLAALQGCFRLGSSLFLDQFMSLLPQGGAAELTSAIQGLKPAMIIAASLTMVLAIVLLIGGIGLTKRNPRSPKTCRIWAGLKMLLVIYSSIVTFLYSQAQMEAMQRMLEEDPNTAGAMPGLFGTLMAIIGPVILVFAIVWGWALPIFMLIWSSRRKIKAEIAQWGRQASALG